MIRVSIVLTNASTSRDLPENLFGSENFIKFWNVVVDREFRGEFVIKSCN